MCRVPSQGRPISKELDLCRPKLPVHPHLRVLKPKDHRLALSHRGAQVAPLVLLRCVLYLHSGNVMAVWTWQCGQLEK